MRRRVVSVADVPEPASSVDPDPLVRAELRDAVRRSFALLDERCQRPLRMLTADPPPPYDTVGEVLAMPHGSIGPTRRRCLESLRTQPPLRAVLEEPR